MTDIFQQLVEKGKKCALLFAPHTDDEMHGSGLLLRLGELGWRLALAVATNGNRGHTRIDPPELAAIRRREMTAVASTLGAGLHFLGTEDTEVRWSLDCRNQIIAIIRQCRANLVLAPAANDYHSDHRWLSALVCDAAYLCGVPHLQTVTQNGEPILACPPPQVWFYETHGGIGFEPDVWIDISAQHERKMAALRCHSSQIEFLGEHDHFDLVEYVNTKDHWHGLQSGHRFAEVFRIHRMFPVEAL